MHTRPQGQLTRSSWRTTTTETRPTSAMASIRTLNDGDPVKVSGSWSPRSAARCGSKPLTEASAFALGRTRPTWRSATRSRSYGNLDIQDGEMVIVPTRSDRSSLTATSGTVPARSTCDRERSVE